MSDNPHATGSRAAKWEDCERFVRKIGYCVEGKECSCGWYEVYTEDAPDATRRRAAVTCALTEAYKPDSTNPPHTADAHATPDRGADRPDRGEKAVTLSLYPNENGLWVWIAYIGDGEVEGSAKGAAGGFEYASDALADAMGRFPQIVVRHAEALQ